MYRKAYNIIFFRFLMENSIVKKMVPWMLKSPLTSVLKYKLSATHNIAKLVLKSYNYRIHKYNFIKT